MSIPYKYLIIVLFVLSGCSYTVKECAGVQIVPLPIPYTITTMDTCTGEVKTIIMHELKKHHEQLQQKPKNYGKPTKI